MFAVLSLQRAFGGNINIPFCTEKPSPCLWLVVADSEINLLYIYATTSLIFVEP